MFSKNKLVFVDEIHRLNKSEQDTLLLAVESGEIKLFGATTENPAITVNPALLSRVLIFKVENFNLNEYSEFFDNINNHFKNKINLDNECMKALIEYANNDLRRIINLLEAIYDSGENDITVELLNQFIDVRLSFDKNDKYSYISALIKSIRGSDPDAAILYLAYMLENGEDPMYLARRIVISAGEDIGLSDPNALNLAVSAMTATEKIGYPECFIPLSEAVIYLSSTYKSNSSYTSYLKASDFIEKNNFELPKKIVNPLNKTMKKQGFGKDYNYPHDYEKAFFGDSYMPIGFEKTQFYKPKELGVEKKLKERLKILWKEKKDYQ